MHTWPLVTFLSFFSLLLGVILWRISESQKSISQAIVAFILFYGSISSAVITLVFFIWHFHDLRGLVIHYHPIDRITQTVLFSAFGIDFDLFSFVVISLTLFFMITALLYSQFQLRKILTQLHSQSSQDLNEVIRKNFDLDENVKTVVIKYDEPLANSFTLLKFQKWGFKTEDWIFLSSGLIEILTWDELETSFWHEYAHISEHDTRYAHLIVTLSSIIRFDPILRFVRRQLEFKHEIEADKSSAFRTRKPKALASALLKLLEFEVGKFSFALAPSLIGNKKNNVIKRIELLLELDEHLNKNSEISV